MKPDDPTRIRRAAIGHLLDHVGNRVLVGRPTYDAEGPCWTVSIMCPLEQGIMPVGQMTLDDDGNVLQAPSKQELIRRAEEAKATTPVLVYASPDELRNAGFRVATASL